METDVRSPDSAAVLIAELSDDVDLQTTVVSGRTLLLSRKDTRIFEEQPIPANSSWHRAAHDGGDETHSDALSKQLYKMTITVQDRSRRYAHSLTDLRLRNQR